MKFITCPYCNTSFGLSDPHDNLSWHINYMHPNSIKNQYNKELKMETFTASVVFADSPRKYDAKYARKYTFKCDIPVENGDMVVVDCVNGYQVVKVVAISEGVHEQATAWVLSKVDMNGHIKRARIAELEKLIEKEVSKVSYRAQAEMLSGISLNFKPNEKLRKLMFELNELTGA